jgi:hypothetical protein
MIAGALCRPGPPLSHRAWVKQDRLSRLELKTPLANDVWKKNEVGGGRHGFETPAGRTFPPLSAGYRKRGCATVQLFDSLFFGHRRSSELLPEKLFPDPGSEQIHFISRRPTGGRQLVDWSDARAGGRWRVGDRGTIWHEEVRVMAATLLLFSVARCLQSRPDVLSRVSVDLRRFSDVRSFLHVVSSVARHPLRLGIVNHHRLLRLR